MLCGAGAFDVAFVAATFQVGAFSLVVNFAPSCRQRTSGGKAARIGRQFNGRLRPPERRPLRNLREVPPDEEQVVMVW